VLPAGRVGRAPQQQLAVEAAGGRRPPKEGGARRKKLARGESYRRGRGAALPRLGLLSKSSRTPERFLAAPK